MPEIKYIEGQNVRAVDCPQGASLLEASLASGIPHYHACGGMGKCSTCRVLVVEGLDSLPPRSAMETAFAVEKRWPDNIRLACQTRPTASLAARRIVTDDIDADMASGEIKWPSAEEREIAVLFCDIERFTTIAGSHPAYDVIHALNRFFKQTGDPILANGGVIEKYLGDGMLAHFGIDGVSRADASLRAVRAGLRMLTAARSLNKYLQEHFGFSFEIRIGIHFGRVLIGQVGHPEKLELTVIGDTVNVAKRIEAANKQFGTRFLVSEELLEPIRDNVELGKCLAPTQLPGQERLVQLYEVVGFRTVDSCYLVQTTFEQIAPVADSFAKSFYQCLFERRPELEALFANTEMFTMRRMLMRMIGLTVRGLPEVSPRLVELGARHAKYGVHPEDYADAEAALLHALRVHLGPDFVPEVEEAWRTIFQAIRDAMLSGV